MEESVDIRKERKELVWFFIKVFLVFFAVHLLLAEVVMVSGNSMKDSLEDKDRLLIEKITTRTGHLSRFDIIVFQTHLNGRKTYLIKRIVAMPEETLKIQEGSLYINGELLLEEYGMEPIEKEGIAAEEIQLGKDEYFVLGDNRNNSKDSRLKEIGVIHKNQIIGRAVLCIWPPAHIQWIHPE